MLSAVGEYCNPATTKMPARTPSSSLPAGSDNFEGRSRFTSWLYQLDLELGA